MHEANAVKSVRRTAMRSFRSLVVLGAVGAALASVPPATAQSTVHATYGGITSSCRQNGLDFSGHIDLSLPAGSTVRHTYRVFNSTSASALGTDDTPVPAPVTSTIPFSDPQYFGGAWTGGLPFTYEQTTQVLIAGANGSETTAYTQVVAVSCATAGAAGAVTITEFPAASTTTTSAPASRPTPAPKPVPAAAPTAATKPARAATPITAEPHFTG